MVPVPVHDTAPSRTAPLANIAIIAACTASFLWLFLLQQTLSHAQFIDAIQSYWLIPNRLWVLAERSGFFSTTLYVPLLTAPLIHLSLLHLMGNMFFLYVLGDSVEDRLGHTGYVAFYFWGGIFAGLAHALANPGSVVPTVGASGAVAAVMGTYFVFFPRARITFRIPLFPFFSFEIPALAVLAVWIGIQIALAASQGPADAAEPRVAVFAHLGGFAFGCLVGFGLRPPILTRRRRSTRESEQSDGPRAKRSRA